MVNVPMCDGWRYNSFTIPLLSHPLQGKREEMSADALTNNEMQGARNATATR